jgi:hypothetical protein
LRARGTWVTGEDRVLRLRSTLDLVEGPYLGGSNLDWAEERRIHLDAVQEEGRLELVRLLLELGRPEEARTECDALLAPGGQRFWSVDGPGDFAEARASTGCRRTRTRTAQHLTTHPGPVESMGQDARLARGPIVRSPVSSACGAPGHVDGIALAPQHCGAPL